MCNQGYNPLEKRFLLERGGREVRSLRWGAFRAVAWSGVLSRIEQEGYGSVRKLLLNEWRFCHRIEGVIWGRGFF